LETEIEYSKHKPKNKVSVVLLRGEYESFQLIIESDENRTFEIIRNHQNSSLDFQFRKLVEYNGAKDVLVPCGDYIQVENSKHLWITYYADKDTPPGTIEEELIFKSDSDSLIIDVAIDIQDITMPEISSIPVVFGVDPTRIINPGESGNKEIMDLLLDYRISPYLSTWIQGSMRLITLSSPYSWDDDRTISYFSDPRLTAIALPYFGLTENDLENLLGKVESAGLIDKTYFYIWDEPDKTSEYDQIKGFADLIYSINPNARVLTTFWGGPFDGPHANDFYAVFDLLTGHTDIFCTNVSALRDNESNARRVIGKLREGEEWWTYVATDGVPGFAYNSTPIQNRAIMWRTWKENSTGFLYWLVNGFNSFQPLRTWSQISGDGVLVYPGEPFGVEDPVVSVRLERFRDGLEDFELLRLIENKMGRNFAENLLRDVYNSSLSITEDSDEVEHFRWRMIQEILN